MSTAIAAVSLEIVQQQINRYVPIFLLFIGIFGNLLNCLVFIHRTLRSNPCCVYLLGASLVNLIIFTLAFIPRIINGWNSELDLTETVTAVCQLVLFILFSTTSIAIWMITFATIDRYLTSSPNIHRRQMSTLKNTFLSILLICIVLPIIWLEVFFCFDTNMVNTPIKCFVKSNLCHVYNDLAQAIVVIIIPVALMLGFGFCTIKNSQQFRRVVPNNINRPTILTNRRSQNSLTKMLLTQVLIITLLTLPLAILTFYMSFTFNQEKSSTQNAVETLLFNIFILIEFIPNCMSFLLFTLTGSIFRKELIRLGKKTIRFLRYYH